MASSTCVSEDKDAAANFTHQQTSTEMVLPRSTAKQVIPIGQPGSQSTTTRRELEKEAITPTTQGTPGRVRQFKGNAESKSSPVPERYLPEPNSQLQTQLNSNYSKAGMCVICSCTNPKLGDPIIGCTAPQKMSKCFGDDLGFSVVEVHSDLSIETMRRLLCDLGKLRIPKSCDSCFRFLFYFFGHGNNKELCLTNGNLPRSEIVLELQKIDKSLCKILLLDSCRREEKAASSVRDDTTVVMPFQATKSCDTKSQQVIGNLRGGSEWEDMGKFPLSVNTLVIYSTDEYGEAFYPTSEKHKDMKGCGLVTYFFTKLASTLNLPLPAVLVEVRQKVDAFITENATYRRIGNPQVLVFDDRLMKNINLLAESKGKVRVKPKIVQFETGPTMTIVQWVFRLNVDERIKWFEVVCRDDQQQPVDIGAKTTLKNVAEFKNTSLQPTKRYYIKVLAVYKDDFKSESEESSYMLSNLVSPNSIKVTPVIPGGPVATVNWEFNGRDTELMQFQVELDGMVVADVCPSDRDAKISGLLPSTTHSIKVIALFKDQQQTECQTDYTNSELQCDEITHIELTRLSPLTLDVHWRNKTPVLIDYKVTATGGSVPVSTVCQGTHARLEHLQPGTNYSLEVEMCLDSERDDNPKSKTVPYTTPTEDEMKPVIEHDEPTRSSVVVRVSEPPIIQQRDQFQASSIQLESVKICRTPEEGDRKPSEFHEIWKAIGRKPAKQGVTLAGCIPGNEYRVKCEVTYSTGDVFTNEAVTFTSASPNCLQRVLSSPRCILFYCLVLLLLSLLLSMPYIPYLIYLKGSIDVQTHYASTNTAIDCGTGNSRTHNGISLKGSLQRGDTLDGVINAWLVRRDKLKLYSQKAGPYIDGYRPLPGDHTVQLSGWNVYLWVGSVISGYCCVQNENGTERTVSIFLFTSFDDSLNFRSGGHAENYILTETLTIPQGYDRCFSIFGQDKPLTVNESSYHIFVVQFSANNMNFSSEIDYLQNYVNTSDYSHPHEFQYDSQIHLQFPTGPEHPTDYIAICKAPDYVTLKTAHPEAGSIHIQSWGSQYWWDTLFIVTFSISLLMCVYTAAASFFVCVWHAYKKQYLSNLNKSRDGYTSFN